MRKFGLFLLGTIAAIVILCSLGSLIGLAFSALLVFAGMHYYLKSSSTMAKVIWVIIGLFGLTSAIANLPGFLCILAIAALWYIIRKWNNKEVVIIKQSNDPFTNFEKQWQELTK